MQPRCRYCQEPFTRRSRNQVYCSVRCSYRWWYDGTPERHAWRQQYDKRRQRLAKYQRWVKAYRRRKAQQHKGA